ncbi:MAG: hypothetical protein K8R35_00730, partial [Bacteroidales bacterium]|nr:hypothetical protein [Bacteroidales bacterium]
ANGGIINEFWDFIIGGDGFDALPVPGDPGYCYAQSQKGALRRIDLVTGKGQSIRPQTEGKERLRFNWNAAIAQDPFDNNTIYFGSQFVHKSTSRGDSWEKISPDLSTNDPEKLKQRQSGGLTIDATGAENHCTILAITPDVLDQNVIWAGTDDGNIQLTTNGGETWTEVGKNIKNMTEKSWVAQIKVSNKNSGEAFVVVNNYRQGDYSAYLYHTANYGKSWERIIDDTDVWGYLLSFIQDPVEEKLMFAGTEYGLYVSFDAGKVWNRWTINYPTVSTYDLVIHPREHDLVIGTFGRSIWIIDDIRPLRRVASEGVKMLENELVLIDPPVGTMAQRKNLPGYYFRADAMFMGDNRNIAAYITYYLKDNTDDKVKISVTDENNNVIRNMEFDAKKGFNRIEWRFDTDPHEMPGMIARQQSQQRRSNMFRFRRGAYVLPGEYKLSARIDEVSSETTISVESDPRLPAPNVDAVKANHLRGYELQNKIKAYNSKYQSFTSVRDKLTKMNDLITDDMSFAEEYKEIYKTVNSEYKKLNRRFTSRDDGFRMKMFRLNILYSATDKLTDVEEKSVTGAIEAMDEAEALIDGFMDREWNDYKNFFKEKNITLDKLIE